MSVKVSRCKDTSKSTIKSKINILDWQSITLPFLIDVIFVETQFNKT